MEENKKNKTKKIAFISIIVLVLILGFIGYFIYYMTYTDNNGEDNIDDDDLKYTLDVYKDEYALCKEKSDTCKDIAFSIPTKDKNAKIIDFDQDYLFVLYEDNNELRIFNRKLEESLGVSLENKYANYEIYSNKEKSNITGILYRTSDNKAGYFNVSSGNKLYDKKYESMNKIGDALNACNGNKLLLLNDSVEKEELTYQSDTNCKEYFPYSFVIEKLNDKMFYRVVGEFDTYVIYSNSKKIIYDKQLKEEEVSFNDGYLYLVENKKIKKYDVDGKLISTSKEYNNIKGLLLNYVIYVQDNYLMLLNIDNEEYKVIDKWNNDYSYDTWNHSGYYTREMLDRMGETAKPEGLYIVVYYKEQDKNGNYGIEYCYTKDKEIKTFEVKTPAGGRAKPVLYLYPTKTTNIKVEFAHPEYLTTTYPKYKNSWNVVAHSNGDLYDKDGKNYYALYWDEVRYNEVDFNEGFYVESKDAINFLEEKLDILGLNDKERNEFIMYWLPILEQNEKSLVYFEQTMERELGNKLIITPKPDSMLRISIHIKRVKEKINIKEQKLKTFNRYGFTAIEWGGMIY